MGGVPEDPEPQEVAGQLAQARDGLGRQGPDRADGPVPDDPVLGNSKGTLQESAGRPGSLVVGAVRDRDREPGGQLVAPARVPIVLAEEQLGLGARRA